MSAPRRLEYVALSEIKRARRNPKRHDAEEIEASLHRFGVGELPLIDERTGLLVAGEGRVNQLDAMYAADRTKPPGGIQVSATGEWLVPVVTGWASTDDAEADAYLITSNRLGPRGGWDGLDLADMLHGLDDLTGVGYSQAELDDLFAASGYLDDAAAMLDELTAVAVPDFTEPEPEPEPRPEPQPEPEPQRAPAAPPSPPARPALDPFSPTGQPQSAPPPPQAAPAPAHSPALPAQASPAAGGTEPQWFQINWSATHAQREIIYEAIRLGRDRLKAASSVAALAAVCQAYVDSVAA